MLRMIQKCDEENIKHSLEKDVGGGSKTSQHLCRLSWTVAAFIMSPADSE